MKSIKRKKLTNIIPLPMEKVLFYFEWLKHFDDTEKVEFLLELFSAVRKVQEQSDWKQVTDLVEDWKATANINADAYLDFGKLKWDSVVAQLSKLVFGESDSRNQDRIRRVE